MNIKRVIRQIEKEEREVEVIRTLALSLQERYEVEHKDCTNYWATTKGIESVLSSSLNDAEKIVSIKQLMEALNQCS